MPRYRDQGMRTARGSHEPTIPVLRAKFRSPKANISAAAITANQANGRGQGFIDLTLGCYRGVAASVADRQPDEADGPDRVLDDDRLSDAGRNSKPVVGRRYLRLMTRPNAVWLVFLLLGLVFGAAAVALFTTGSVNVFAWVTLACAVVILASAAVGHRRSRLRP
jgi:hypothetical protein